MFQIVHMKNYLACNVRHVVHIFVQIVDIICIGHIASYLSCNVRPIFHIYSYSVSDWCITSFTVCILICFSIPY